MLNGAKTYIVGIAMLALAGIDLTFYDVPQFDGSEMLMLALGLMGLRHGVGKGA